MAGNPAKLMSELFTQAAQTFDQTMRTGVKVQEEWTQWWSDLAGKTTSFPEWQKQVQAVVSEAIPAAQKSTEDCLRAIDEGRKNSLELLEKAFECGKSESVADLQAKTQEIWESALQAMRNNAETMAKLNARTMSLWADLASNVDGSSTSQ